MRKFLSLFFIIVSGETIFMLPFMLPRLYRPLMIEAWGLTNTDIGAAFSAYGIAAMFSYILGGPFSDKYPPRRLLFISLLVTGLAGLLLILNPSRLSFISLYFFFGVSTIFLMWGALIKATHVTGGEEYRSSAMGVLDAGRGLFAAAMSSSFVIGLSVFYSPEEISSDPLAAMNFILFFAIVCTLIVSTGVLCFVKTDTSKKESPTPSQNQWNASKAFQLLKDAKVWLLGIVILASYCGYKSLDNYSIFMVDIHKLTSVEAAKYMSVIFWLRPISAFLAGLFADWAHKKIDVFRFKFLSFLLIGSALTQFSLSIDAQTFSLVLATIFTSAAFAFALRAIYFSVFGDLNIPKHLVGTTTGIVSFVGFLPDIFFGVVTGYLIDSFTGMTGYNYSFYFTGTILAFGAIANLILLRKVQ